MATYNTAFGSLPGYNEMLGTTNTTGGGQQNVYGQRAQQQRQQQQQPAPAQTFAQLQQRGMARPAPPQAPQAQAFGQFGGSQQAQQMRQNLQQQLQQFGQAPSRFDTQAFQQIRGAQAANIQAEFSEQQRRLNEDLARRGLSASNIAGSGLASLGGAQARALADLDAQLLQRAAETQAADRAQLLQAGQGFAELAGAQDLAQFEANRVAQAATFENQLRAAQFGQQQFEQGGQEAFQAAQAEEAAQQAARQFDLAATGQAGQLSLDLQRLLGQQEVERAQLTGTLGGQQTLAGQQLGEQRRQFDIQQALQQQLGLGGLTVEQGRLALQQQQLTEEQRQFGLTLTEQQAARNQQLGISNQELAIERDRLIAQGDQFGRQLNAQVAQNQAQNNLEQKRIDEAIATRTTGVAESALERQLRQQLQTQQITSSTAESALERALRERLQTQEITAQAGESLAERNLRQALQTQQITSADAQALAERNLRQTLQTQQLSTGTSDLLAQLANQLSLQTLTGTQAQQRQAADLAFQREALAVQQIISNAISAGKVPLSVGYSAGGGGTGGTSTSGGSVDQNTFF